MARLARARVAAARSRRSRAGGCWCRLPAAGAGWLLGELGTVNAVSQFAFVAMLVLAVPTVIGTRAARRIAFPLAFLFFAVPVGRVPDAAADGVDRRHHRARRSGSRGIPVYREGQNFIIPSGNWSVVEACSGVRYLIASLVIGTLYAYLTYRSTLAPAGLHRLFDSRPDRRQLGARVHDRDDRTPVGQQARGRRRPPHLRLAVLRRS